MKLEAVAQQLLSIFREFKCRGLYLAFVHCKMEAIVRVRDSQTRLKVRELWIEWTDGSSPINDARERMANACNGNRRETQSCFRITYTVLLKPCKSLMVSDSLKGPFKESDTIRRIHVSWQSFI